MGKVGRNGTSGQVYRRGKSVQIFRWRHLATILFVLSPLTWAGPAGLAKSPAAGPASLVNEFIGTGSGGKVTGDVDTFPGAAMPFGMLTWSPTTPSRPDGGDYAYQDTSTLGFSLTHLSGPGCPAAGEVPILPTVGRIGNRPDAMQEPFSHKEEWATPGEYRVKLDPGSKLSIGTVLAVTRRSGIGRFRFPVTQKADFLFKVADGQTTTAASQVRIVGNHTVTGMETSGFFCGAAASETLYFVATFNRPFHSFGTWQGHRLQQNTRATAGTASGAWVRFATGEHGTVKLKVAISYVSQANAWANLRAEDPGWSVKEVARKAHKAWDRLLSRIQVRGGTHDEQVQFYTALYHALLHPNVFSDVNGQYIGFDDHIHHLDPGQAAQYANFSGWDIYRSEIPLLTLLVPQRVDNMVTSLLNDEHQGGWLPKWGYDNDYTGVMNGDAADPIIAEAFAFGARGFDAHAALKAMVKGATKTYAPGNWSGTYVERPHLLAYERLGYVPGNASETLEYATDDFAIARLAQGLHDPSVHRQFLRRSQNWAHVFDKYAKYRGYSGYMEPRSAAGTFPMGSAFKIRAHSYGQRGFEEGNTLQYTWMVTQDLKGLIQAMGGNRIAVQRLNTVFKHLNVGPNKPYYWAGNEPGLSMPWIYDYAGDPAGTQSVVHRIALKEYSDTPGGEPGNDDLGAMSSWLVWAYLGMYPETPGTSVLAFSGPIFPSITIHLGNGGSVQIRAKHASMHSFVRNLQLNGKVWPEDWISAWRAFRLGEPSGSKRVRLKFEMEPQPAGRWGKAPGQEPPSFAAGPLDLQ